MSYCLSAYDFSWPTHTTGHTECQNNIGIDESGLKECLLPLKTGVFVFQLGGETNPSKSVDFIEFFGFYSEFYSIYENLLEIYSIYFSFIELHYKMLSKDLTTNAKDAVK